MNQIITLKKEALIEETLKNASEEINLAIEKILDLEVTADSKKIAKEKRSFVTKLFNELETQRKELKKVYMQPYEQMLAKYKELIEIPYKKAKIQIDDKIAYIENVEKKAKEDEIRTFFESLKVSKNLDFLEFENLNIKVGLSNSIKSLKDKIFNIVIDIEKDLKTISNLDYKDEISVYYKQSLDLNDSIQKVMFLKSEAKREEEERLQIEQNNIIEEKNIEEEIIPIAELELDTTDSINVKIDNFEINNAHSILNEILEVTDDKNYEFNFNVMCSIEKAKLINKLFLELKIINE